MSKKALLIFSTAVLAAAVLIQSVRGNQNLSVTLITHHPNDRSPPPTHTGQWLIFDYDSNTFYSDRWLPI